MTSKRLTEYFDEKLAGLLADKIQSFHGIFDRESFVQAVTILPIT